MLIVAGRKTNLFAECLELSASTSNPLLPVANVCDDDPSSPAGALDTENPWYLLLDGRLKEITDPHFDSVWSGAPAGWGKGASSDVVRDTATKDGGVASVRFDHGRAQDYIYRSAQVACGAKLDLTCSMRHEDLAFGVKLQIMCRDTGLNWNGSGWVADTTAVVFWDNALAADTWHAVSGSISVPNLNDTDVATLMFILRPMPSIDFPTKKTWVDNFRVLPRASIISVHHPHNCIGAEITIETSPDQGTWTVRATILGSSAPREAFASFDQVSSPWWLLRFKVPSIWAGYGTFSLFPEPPAIGEAVLALARQVPGTWRKATQTFEVPQARAGQGDRYRQAQAGGALQRITLERMGATAGDWQMILNRLFLESQGGARNSLVVWDESVASRVILGAIEPEFSVAFDVTKANVPHRITVSGYAPPIWSA